MNIKALMIVLLPWALAGVTPANAEKLPKPVTLTVQGGFTPDADEMSLSWSASAQYLDAKDNAFWPFKPPQMIPAGAPITYEVYRWKYLGTEPATKVASVVNELSTTVELDPSWNSMMCWCVVAVVNGVTGMQSDDKCLKFGG